MSRIKSKFKRTFLSLPNMGGEELNLVKEAFDSNYVAPLRSMVDAFEYEFAEKVGISHALALSSGIAAMSWRNSFTPVKWPSPRLNSLGLNRAFHGVNIP